MLQIYADNMQIYLAIKPSNANISTERMEMCLIDIHQWMSSNFLKLNSAKTECLLIGTFQQLAKFNISALNVAGVQVTLQQKPVRNLGVMFEKNMTMKGHVPGVVRSVSYHIRNISRIHLLLTPDSAKKLVNSLVTSCLDYCNCLLTGVSDKLLTRLQWAQDWAARVVLQIPRSTPVALDELHWLPIKERIKFKLAVTVFKAINGLAPDYLSDLVAPYQTTRSLRSSDTNLLAIPKPNLVRIGDRPFRVAGPLVWNVLPNSLRAIKNLPDFKKKLKTHFYRLAFNVKRQ